MMDFNLTTNIETCFNLVRDTVNVSLIYYTHIPTSVVSLIIGVLVFRKNKTILGKSLLVISVAFSLWTICSLITWTSYNSQMYMFFWSFFGILTALIYVFSAYFAYIFLFGKDVKKITKIIAAILLLPVFLLTPTRFAIEKFDLTSCIAIENPNFMWYYYAFGLVSFLIIIYLGIKKYIQTRDKIERKKSLLFTVGIEMFVLTFWFTGFLASYLVEVGLVSNYNLEPYGLFGMTVFMGFLAYLIVKFKAFKIKLLGAQVLMAAIIALVGAQYLFTPLTDTTNIVLISVTVFVSVVLGIWLIRSVKREVEKSEELEIANKEITERKDELQRLTDSLAATNDKLRIINAKLEKIDATKTDFIYIASHQLHKIPTPIKGYLALLLEGSYGELSKEQRRVLENIKAANERQINLVDDLLDVARMESGKIRLNFKKQQLEDVCREMYANFLPIAEKKGLKFKYVHPEKPLPELIFDKGKMFEAIFNFVDNAVKYTNKGKIDFKIELDADSHYELSEIDEGNQRLLAGPVVRVTVADTGVGIAKENIPFLFAKFSRKDTANLNIEGTGLGLYVVKLMIEVHGGRTWVESDGEGKGSKFIIEIPTDQPENVAVKE